MFGSPETTKDYDKAPRGLAARRPIRCDLRGFIDNRVAAGVLERRKTIISTGRGALPTN